MRLSRGAEEHYVHGYQFGLDTASSALLALDKAATDELLRHAAVPAVEHRLVMHPEMPGGESWDGVRRALDSCLADWPAGVVCKPNQGTGGRDVRRAHERAELEAAATALLERHRMVSLSPYLPIAAEYRAVVLDGEVLLLYEKVPAAGEWRHNLELGARPRHVEDGTVAAELAAIAKAATRALGLRFATVDIIATEVAGAGASHRVLEVNSAVMLERYARAAEDGVEQARRIYAAAVERLFGVRE